MHVLLIDDDIGDVGLVVARLNQDPIFKQKGSVYGHEYGMKRLVFYSKADVDLIPNAIVLEAKFAEGSAIDLIRFAKASKKMKTVPIVVYTGTDDEETRRACLAAGAIKVISKGPRGPEELAAYVATLAPKAT